MLELHLTPLPPTRRPLCGGSHVLSGYRLGLPDGCVLDEDDPLLASFGALVTRLGSTGREDALQDDAFAPGRALVLLDAVDGSDDEVSVWSADGVRLAGALDGCAGEQVAAGVGFGQALRAVVLNELCDARTGRRGMVDVLVAPTLGVQVEVGLERAWRPARREPRRLVLIADDLALWDPTGDHGPVDAAALGLSPALVERLSALRLARTERGEVSGALDAMVERWEQEELALQTRGLWRRLRAELGQRCEVGYLGPGMSETRWDDEEPPDEDDDIPF